VAPVIVVAGHLLIVAGERDAFVERSREAVELARGAPGCHDFAVSADPADPDRVNVYERWADRSSLLAFRGEGPSDDLREVIAGAEVSEFEVQPGGPTG
jgi:quinol monooxygenase YgiN